MQFNTPVANVLRKQPYYQCGVAIYDKSSENVKTAKFSSSGLLEKQLSHDAETEPESQDLDEDQKQEQLKQIDYGYRERAVIEPDQDCFAKLSKAFEKDPNFSGVKSNMSIMHSRFAEIRRYYTA